MKRKPQLVGPRDGVCNTDLATVSHEVKGGGANGEGLSLKVTTESGKEGPKG